MPDFSTAWKLFFHGVENRGGGRKGPACHAGRRGTKHGSGLCYDGFTGCWAAILNLITVQMTALMAYTIETISSVSNESNIAAENGYNSLSGPYFGKDG